GMNQYVAVAGIAVPEARTGAAKGSRDHRNAEGQLVAERDTRQRSGDVRIVDEETECGLVPDADGRRRKGLADLRSVDARCRRRGRRGLTAQAAETHAVEKHRVAVVVLTR